MGALSREPPADTRAHRRVRITSVAAHVPTPSVVSAFDIQTTEPCSPLVAAGIVYGNGGYTMGRAGNNVTR